MLFSRMSEIWRRSRHALAAAQGRGLGRFDGPIAITRGLAIDGLDLSDKSVLEIGPLTNPIVSRAMARAVAYMDHLSTEELRQKYRHESSFDVADIVDVDFVARDGRIAAHVDGRTFDVIIAAHVIEHVPDLIGWLEEAASVLTPGGILALIVPDKRYTFDVCRRLSPLREIESAYREKRTRPALWNTLDHFANVVHANTDELWSQREEAYEGAPIHSSDDLATAIEHWKAGHYIDVHCWVFTPAHFRKVVSWAANRFDLPFRERLFIDTPFRNLEFYVQLQKTASDPACERRA